MENTEWKNGQYNWPVIITWDAQEFGASERSYL